MKIFSRFSIVLLMLGMTSLFLSCASSKKASVETPQIPASQLVATAVSNSVAQREIARGIQAKSTLTLSMGGSGVPVGGNFKMIRDEIIQINMTVMGFVEVARIELTPSYVLIMDRQNKRYIKAGWNEICLEEMGFSFQTFQSLFWEELFLLGSKENPTIQDFVFSGEGNNTLVPAVQKNSCASTVQFVLDAATGRLSETQLGLRGPHNLDLAWKYKSHTTLGKGSFPSSMQLTSNKEAQQLSVTLDLSRVEINNNLHDIATNVNDGKYKPITMDEVLNMYRSLVK